MRGAVTTLMLAPQNEEQPKEASQKSSRTTNPVSWGALDARQQEQGVRTWDFQP